MATGTTCTTTRDQIMIARGRNTNLTKLFLALAKMLLFRVISCFWFIYGIWVLLFADTLEALFSHLMFFYMNMSDRFYVK
jgi:hypothetical protein